jgi:hypothetical protein
MPLDKVASPSKDVPEYEVLQSDWEGPLSSDAPQFVKVTVPVASGSGFL